MTVIGFGELNNMNIYRIKLYRTAKFALHYILVSLVLLGILALKIFIGAQFWGETWAINLPERIVKNQETCWTIEEVAETYNCKGK
jgi:hypothetical protein